jgi:DNA (cytosine-5)-methyltransferase 1
MTSKFEFYEFFAGAGMARAGLGDGWTCLFANDDNRMKQEAYRARWGDDHLDRRDIHDVRAGDLSGSADLAWASFPCQDLSVAGGGLGIGEAGSAALTRSGAVWPFLALLEELAEQGRAPTLVVLENVLGLMTSAGGKALHVIGGEFARLDYMFGAVVVDACHFLPQSRPRVFVIALRRGAPIPAGLTSEFARDPWHPPALVRARAGLGPAAADRWLWWNLGEAPTLDSSALSRLVDLGDAPAWDAPEQTARLIAMMPPSHLERLRAARAAGVPRIGSLYLRMRPRPEGGNIQRAEIAFGPTLGCLRTARGGASRPRIIVAEEGRVRTRLLSRREAADLMGLDKGFVLPAFETHALQLLGDGVAVPVVRFLADRLLEPLSAAAGCDAEPDERRAATG